MTLSAKKLSHVEFGLLEMSLSTLKTMNTATETDAHFILLATFDEKTYWAWYVEKSCFSVVTVGPAKEQGI